jgi:hypothetical protein
MNRHAHIFYTLCALCLALASACSISKVFTSTPAISITAESLTSAYSENEAAADRKYKGKLLAVTGTIESLLVTEKGGRGISLKGANTRYLSGVLCTVSDKQKEIFEKLKEGQQVTVEGTCEGLDIADVSLADCSIK